jgi:hypothetical protein
MRAAMLRRDNASPTIVPLVAVVLVIVGLTIGPLLLLRPEVEQLRLGNLRVQLYAAFLYWTVGAVLMVGPFIAIATLPGDWFERWWSAAETRFMEVSDRTVAMCIVIVAIAIAAGISIFSFERHPSTADGVAQLWHARILLSGRLSLPPDPNGEFFAVDNVIDRPWMSQFPIGTPALLAMGLLVKGAWLMNPLLTGVIVLNVYRFVGRAYGEGQARVAAVIAMTSPMLLIMGGSHMNHVPTAALITTALAALPAWVTRETSRAEYRAGAVIGASIGAAVTIRPLDGVVAGLVLGIFMLGIATRSPDRARARSLLLAAAVGAVPLGLLLWVNWRTTGGPLHFGYEMLWGPLHSLGLHDDPVGHPHTAWRAVNLAIKYLVQVNWVATAWPLPVLLVAAVGLLFAETRNRWDALVLSHFCAQLAAYAFYWHDGQFVGPRFLFSAIPGILVLAARAPFLIADRVSGGVCRRLALVIVPVCVVTSWIAPMQPFGGQAMAIEYRELRKSFKVPAPSEIRTGAVRNALVFIQEGASARLVHRLWGVGVSRADAARLVERFDGCSLFEAVRAEETQPTRDSLVRVRRMTQRARPFIASVRNVRAADVNFRVNDSTSVTPACAAEMDHDRRLGSPIAYGPMLLLNHIDSTGRIGGDAVFVMDLRDRNELLRARFGDRQWYRYEIPRTGDGRTPVLVPY